jgi:hypothetical protein
MATLCVEGVQDLVARLPVKWPSAVAGAIALQRSWSYHPHLESASGLCVFAFGSQLPPYFRRKEGVDFFHEEIWFSLGI